VFVNGKGLCGGAGSLTVRSGELLADIAELELYSGKVSAQVTANINEIVPRYTLRGKLDSFDAASAGTALFGANVVTGRSTLSVDVTAAGQTPAELLRAISGKAALAMAEGARVGLDVKAMRAAAIKAGGAPGWGVLAKGQTSLEQVEARCLLRDGVLITELVQARAGPLGLAATGRVDLSERTLDLHLAVKPNAATDKPLTSADMLGAEAVTVRGFWQEPFVRAQEASADTPR
jgi:AsmA protein